MSVLGKIVGQLESGGSSGSSGMNYINTETYTMPGAGTYEGGFVIAKLAEDNKIYKFEVRMTYKTDKVFLVCGFTFNKQVFLLYAKNNDGPNNTSLFTRDDNRLLITTNGPTEVQLEGYTTTPEEVVFEEPWASGQTEINYEKCVATVVEELESKISSLETRIAALESA